MPYKDKHDARYKAARMKWYYANKAKHRQTSNRISHEKKQFINILKQQPCMDCGGIYPYYVMDFDHRDPNTKKFNVANMLHEGLERIKLEIAKCDIVCANCHRVRTHKKNTAH